MQQQQLGNFVTDATNANKGRQAGRVAREMAREVGSLVIAQAAEAGISIDQLASSTTAASSTATAATRIQPGSNWPIGFTYFDEEIEKRLGHVGEKIADAHMVVVQENKNPVHLQNFGERTFYVKKLMTNRKQKNPILMSYLERKRDGTVEVADLARPLARRPATKRKRTN